MLTIAVRTHADCAGTCVEAETARIRKHFDFDNCDARLIVRAMKDRRLVTYRQSQGMYPAHDHHLRFDSDGWSDCRRE